MSAIAGIHHYNQEPIDVSHGYRMMFDLEKYPADQIQSWHQTNIFLGCHAQWITPESVGEKLPYHDTARKLAITADAIIDNRDELFEKLQIEQERRAKMPDSQLILLAYYKWGEESPRYLVGDFAFMIWDERKQRLFGARDFSGTRTLYFHRNQHQFAFCTIIEPLFTLPGVEKKINEHWIAEFLAIPMTTDAMDCFSTVYDQIEQLAPSHSITVDNGKVTFSRYCIVSDVLPLKLKSNEEYEEAFREVFGQAVSARLRTHRQVGSQLSGGLDSGSVVSFAAPLLRKENKRLHTYSYVPVDDFTYWGNKARFANEKPFIQSTVEHVGNITDHYLDFKGLSPLSEIDDWLTNMEMPYKFFENSFWLKGIYEKANQQDVGVLLNGQRGNWTVSWGPALDYQAVLMRKLKWIQLSHEAKHYSMNMGTGRKRVLKAVSKKAFPILRKFMETYVEEPFPKLINPQFAKKMNVMGKIQEHGFDRTDFSAQSAYDVRKNQFERLYSWSLNGTIGTKLSLRYKLWERDPTNDLRVARFCLSVPEDQYVQDGVDRSLIRRATANYLPDKVRLNQLTRGVQGADGVHRMAPSWDAFIQEVEQCIQNPIISEYVNLAEMKSALTKIKSAAKPEYVYEFGFRILMRGLIFSRFMNNLS